MKLKIKKLSAAEILRVFRSYSRQIRSSKNKIEEASNQMSLKDLVNQKSDALKADHQAVLDAVKTPLAGAVKYARAEIPIIEAELATADRWVADNIACIDWKALGAQPKAIAELLHALEAYRGNPQVLRDAIKDFDRLTWTQCWGNRRDGFDLNCAASIRGEIGLRLGVPEDRPERSATFSFD